MRYLNLPVRFTREDAQRCGDEWGANCGPGAIAAVLGMTLDELRPHLGGFEGKGYTNPTLMYWILDDLPVQWEKVGAHDWPTYGLVRIQWHGPWMRPEVPIQARYRKTHWVGCRRSIVPAPLRNVPQDEQVKEQIEIFDINAICCGGWIPEAEWAEQLVPWLVPQFEKQWDGKWSRTHCLEVYPR